MNEVFMMKLDEIQPSQLYVSSEKLNAVMKAIDPVKPGTVEPIPIRKLGRRIIFVDGHTRAFAAPLHGFPIFLCTGKTKNLTGRLTQSASSGARKREFGLLLI